jgi:hypothetical protein
LYVGIQRVLLLQSDVGLNNNIIEHQMSEIFSKGVRTYDFIIIFKDNIDIKNCHSIIKETFIRQFNNDSINCTWELLNIKGIYCVKGSFSSIASIQHKLHIKLRYNKCCESPIFASRILRTSSRKKI